MPTINFSGLASGIDTNALIDATSSATRKQRVEPKQTKIDELTKQNNALTDLETKLAAIKKAAEGMGTLTGGAVAKSASSSAETVATASVSNGALNGSYALSVTSLAKAASYSFNYNYTSSTDTVATLGATDTITFQIGDTSPETVNVNVTPTMTVAEFVTAFNTASSRANASLVQVGTSQYRILITSAESGTDSGSIVSVNRGVGFSGSKLDPSDVVHDAATDAQFTLNGIGPFTRQKNNINDVITGVTFNLLSSPGSATITVSDNPSASVAIVKKFVDAYNEMMAYMVENNAITQDSSSSNGLNVFSALATTRTDDGAIDQLRSALAAIRVSSSSTVAILPDLGITTQRDGTLAFDETKFKSAIATDPTSVNQITMTLGDKFGYTYKSDTGNGIIDSITRFNGTFDISLNSNKTLIDNLNDQIAEIEAQIAQTESNMRSQFSQLEATIGRLQSQQSQLTSALAGLR